VPRQRQVCYPEDVLGAVTAALDPIDPWFHCACCELPTPRRRPGSHQGRGYPAHAGDSPDERPSGSSSRWRRVSFDDLDEPLGASSRTSLWWDRSSLIVRIRARGGSDRVAPARLSWSQRVLGYTLLAHPISISAQCYLRSGRLNPNEIA
jgi:hypothetical protein